MAGRPCPAAPGPALPAGLGCPYEWSRDEGLRWRRGPAGPGSEQGRRRAAWCRAGGSLRPEEKGRPPPRPARAQAALGPGGRPWECASAGRAEGRGSGQPPTLGLAGGGGACGGTPPPSPGRVKEGPSVQSRRAVTGVTAIPPPPPRRSCSIGVLRLFAGVEEGGLVPGCCSGRGRGPRRVLGARTPPPPSYALARTRPENWNPGGAQQPRSQVLCIIRLHV